MSDTVLLCHISQKKSNVIVSALLGKFPQIQSSDAEKLVVHFFKKLAGLPCVKHIAIEDSAFWTQVQKIYPEVEKFSMIPYQSPLGVVRDIFSDAALNHIIYFEGFYPLWDHVVSEKLLKIHQEYKADFSFVENTPLGSTYEIIARDFLDSVQLLEVKDEAFEKMALREFVEKQINHFQAEVYYEEPDLRMLRLDFSCGNLRSLAQVMRLAEATNFRPDIYAELEPLFAKQPDLLFSTPTYIELEISSDCDFKCIFCPRQYTTTSSHWMSTTLVEKLCTELSAFYSDTTVTLGGVGEPLQNPEAAAIISRLLSTPHIQQVILETNGLRLDQIYSLASHEQIAKFKVILNLNSIEKYGELHGVDAATYEKVLNQFRNWSQALQKHNQSPLAHNWVQVLKINENETEIDALYALTETLEANFLFQKYNRYAGLMVERRVSDMTPLERTACWHLRRDLFIRANGDVAACKQAIQGTAGAGQVRGNIRETPLPELWGRQRADFVSNYQGTFPAHLPCANCDEYFTFNF